MISVSASPLVEYPTELNVDGGSVPADAADTSSPPQWVWTFVSFPNMISSSAHLRELVDVEHTIPDVASTVDVEPVTDAFNLNVTVPAATRLLLTIPAADSLVAPSDRIVNAGTASVAIVVSAAEFVTEIAVLFSSTFWEAMGKV